MAKVSEEISKYNANSGGRTDANIANDALHLGGVKAEDYATKKYVQDYHGTKDAELKEYIDGQDEAKLQEAKAYADQTVNNQDFSGFAKVTDVQAVDEKLTKKIEEYGQHCAENLNTQIQAVVNDTNANFQDVNSAIGQLNANQNNLFQSVSSGKAKVAAAITDKGVTTASDASYDTMAGNIRSIKTGGGELAPGFVNTSDANATSADLLVGKTAYAQGQKIYGTLIQQPGETGMPTYGTDTSNATATEEDIAYGKTAYARGQFLVGTLSRSSTNVEEIYGVDEGGYTQKSLSAMKKDPITGEDITSDYKVIGFSKDLQYCVKYEVINNVKYIASYAVNTNGLYIQQSANLEGIVDTKKYRYTYAELGLEDDEKVIDIKLGSPGFDNNKKCFLFIMTQKIEGNVKTQRLNIYTYHLSDNGQIGVLYSGENTVEIHQTLSKQTEYSYEHSIITFNNKYNQFYLLQTTKRSSDHLYVIKNCKIVNDSIVEIGSTAFTYLYNASSRFFNVSNDDKYITTFGRVDSGTTIEIINNIDDDYYTPMTYNGFGSWGTAFINNTNIRISSEVDYLYISEIGSSTRKKVRLRSTTNASIMHIEDIIITSDNKKIILLTSTPKLYIYDLTETLATEDEGTVNAIQEFEILSNAIVPILFMNYEGNRILAWSGTGVACDFSAQLDTEKIIGLKYKNQYFYNSKQHGLTAEQTDVRIGKTFIGNQGCLETGTMEV